MPYKSTLEGIEIVTVTEIQNYLKRHQRPEEDPINDKKKDRVIRQIAESIKNIKPLTGGKCNLCSKEDNQLVPVSMKVCPTCTQKFLKRGGEIEVLKKDVQDYHCDYCLTRTFTVFHINPKVCIFCSKRIGRTHRHGMREVQKQEIRNRQIRDKRIGGD